MTPLEYLLISLWEEANHTTPGTPIPSERLREVVEAARNMKEKADV